MKAMNEWMARAVCATHDPAIWFPSDGRGNAYKRARELCGICPVAQECLDYAMANEAGTVFFRAGMYGGLTPGQRAKLWREGQQADVRATAGAIATEFEIARFLRMYRAHRSIEEIAGHFDVTTRTIERTAARLIRDGKLLHRERDAFRLAQRQYRHQDSQVIWS